MSMTINDPANFTGRVNLAALIISQGREASRSFDNCFENYDGDAVAVALYRRAQKNPKLAANIWRYLCRQSVTECAAKNAHRRNLSAWSRELVRRDYPTELTPEGEQTVIPGCEKNAAPGKRQLDLF